MFQNVKSGICINMAKIQLKKTAIILVKMMVHLCRDQKVQAYYRQNIKCSNLAKILTKVFRTF